MRDILNFLKENPGYASAISALGVLLITSVFGHLRESMQRKQRFFDRYFSERIKAYNELLGESYELIKEFAVILSLAPSERPKPLAGLINRTNTAFYKNRIWFDKNVRQILDNIFSLLYSTGYLPEEGRLPGAVSDYELKELIKNVTKQHAILVKLIETISGASVLDKEMQRLIKPCFIKRLAWIFRGESKKNKEALERFLDIPDDL